MARPICSTAGHRILRDRIKDLTDGVGAHVAYDPVGGSAFDDLFKSLRPGGRILVIGFASGTVAPFRPISSW